jgi:hypothetical protein
MSEAQPPGPPAPIVKLMGQACHILTTDGRPFCGTDDSPVLHGGLNSADCRVCLARAEREPGAAPRCLDCGWYHDSSPSVVAFFHPSEKT